VHVASWRSTYRGTVPDDYLAGLSEVARERSWARILDARGPEHVWVAETAYQEIVGFASGGPERSGDPDFTGELYAIYLLEEQQRRGVGLMLLRAVSRYLEALGFRSMLVWVLGANPACAFYERLGARPLRRQQVEIGGTTLDEIAYGWTDVRSLAVGV
jgi:GNAT superfamily N-acetyltransferase